VPILPSAFRTYWEPFLGSGSLFFLLQPKRAVLSDSCRELIETFGIVRDYPDRILAWFEGKRPDQGYFYFLRANRSDDPVTRAAEFLYLNRTCWNGLYRVNSRGVFNVPYGKPKTPNLIDQDVLLACSTALQAAELHINDFETAVTRCARGDLVFFDPPYVTGHNNNGFIDYNERLFSWSDQERLADVARRLAAGGVSVIVANAAHDAVQALYDGFDVLSFERSSTLASDSSRRGRTREVLMYSVASVTSPRG
jgi:DNA adenine methylase